MGVVEQLQSQMAQEPLLFKTIGTLLALSVVYYFFGPDRPLKGFPVVSMPARTWKAKYFGDKFTFFTNGRDLFYKGLKECPSCFQVYTGTGYKVVVPSRFADELKNHPDIDIYGALKQDLYVHYPGMDGLKEGTDPNSIAIDVAKSKLPQSLGFVTEDIVDEATHAIHTLIGESPEWTVKSTKVEALELIARVSARAFLGSNVCRDPTWLRISKNYTTDTFKTGEVLRQFPAIVRPFAFWFLPMCARLREEVKNARKVIGEEAARRLKEDTISVAKADRKPNTLDWLTEFANAKGRKVDYTACQLMFTIASMHQTSELLVKCLMQLCNMPEIIQPLREEMVSVLKSDGWSTSTLYKMKLLDSFMREIQRTNCRNMIAMSRVATKKIVLHDGMVIPAGTRLMLADDRLLDENLYDEPEKFQPDRFLRLREGEGEENRHQFVTTSSEHMGFGTGKHACPGRFFVAKEIKVTLTLLLLKYDIRWVPGDNSPKERVWQTARAPMPNLKMQFRRRTEGLDLLNPQEAA